MFSTARFTLAPKPFQQPIGLDHKGVLARLPAFPSVKDGASLGSGHGGHQKYLRGEGIHRMTL